VLTTCDASPHDTETMADLFIEIDRFYGEPITESAEEKIPHINSVLFGSPPLAYALLAWDGASLVGMAAYSFLWPAARTTKSLYLKELYVRQSHRGRGVGKLLMAQIFEIAKHSDCNRVEWMTDDDNAEAQGFYEKLGVSPDQSKIFYRVEGQDRFAVAGNDRQ
jgi:GNAT superfamily N-acetyltransferase